MPRVLQKILSSPGISPAVRELCAPARWYRYFSQGEHWVPNGKTAVAIADMPPEWRLNCMRYLERNASRYARAYADGCHAEALVCNLIGTAGEVPGDVLDVLDRAAHIARSDPATWIKATALYGALAAGLPTKKGALRRLSERARHWDGCPQRQDEHAECSCARVAERERQRRQAIDASLVPEWD